MDIRSIAGRDKQRKDAHQACVFVVASTIAYETLVHRIVRDIFPLGGTGSEHQFGWRLSVPQHARRPYLVAWPLFGHPSRRITS
ncbi:MAG: hypothetical protein ACREP9_22485, partial [Candidatus Dormibacteraceae bacterium]